MAFVIETDFQEVGSHSNKSDGGQVYSVSSDADTLGAMMVSGYLNALATAGKINVRDVILLSGTDGAQLVMVKSISSANVVVVSQVSNLGIAATLSGAGAIPITNASVDFTTTGADALTLADGVIGQEIIITMLVDGGDGVLTPATALGYSTITFADAGDTVHLLFKTLGWTVVGQGGVSTGPVVG